MIHRHPFNIIGVLWTEKFVDRRIQNELLRQRKLLLSLTESIKFCVRGNYVAPVCQVPPEKKYTRYERFTPGDQVLMDTRLFQTSFRIATNGSLSEKTDEIEKLYELATNVYKMPIAS